MPPVWNKIFKDDSTWLMEMQQLQELKPSILPTLVGWRLRDVLRSDAQRDSDSPSRETSFLSRKRLSARTSGTSWQDNEIYLVLLVHDWSGELPYSAGNLLESLKSHCFVSKWDVHIVGTDITLNIAECLGGHSPKGWLHVSDPGSLFTRKGREMHTSVLYYGDNAIRDVGPEHIGGVEGRSTVGKKVVKDICSIKMRLGDGKPVYRVLKSEAANARLKDIITTDECGCSWVTHWKEVKSGWREW
ncbi:hypothetical protein Purlil1_12101 [Purpureocillium lilacinum]|uniref:Uncharacterized protein n=1 Tax=Purpureocillium lilacinum TaxID=33203 RepID=A0ABR0BHR3_PURLI|nr:hypothetical protein Purlil1_12101 [Purpureocillium lilacinum]